MANVGRVILDADLFGLAIDGDVSIETAVVIDTGSRAIQCGQDQLMEVSFLLSFL